jgi:hypothetical protein
MFAMWGSSARDVYAVGAYGEVMRSKGDGTFRTIAIPGKPDVILLTIWGSGASDVYTGGQGGDGVIFHSTGKDDWTVEQVPSKSGVTSIFGLGAKDVYAVSHFLFHSNGDGRWEKIAVPGMDNAEVITGDANGTLYVGGRDGDLYIRENGVWSNTRDKGGGTYQALWSTGDDLYIGTESFLEWTDP